MPLRHETDDDPAHDLDEAEGHGRYRLTEEDRLKDEAEGHALRGRVDGEDVEGHIRGRSAANADDAEVDVEGHVRGRSFTVADEDDDVEGHIQVRGRV